MSLILPADDPNRPELENRGIRCLTGADAARLDVHSLRIGLINIMPMAETYEISLLYPLGRSTLAVEPVWLRLASHKYSSSDPERVFSVYSLFDDALAAGLDALVLTGAPVETYPFEDVFYWPELVDILMRARREISSTLGICWGALALAKLLGVEKVVYETKLFGLFETKNLDSGHRLTGSIDDVFHAAQSRHAGLDDAEMERARDAGAVRLLAHSDRVGYTIFESDDERFLGHMGHPEYAIERIVREYHRDVERGRSDVAPPENVDLNAPLNLGRASGLEFLGRWVEDIARKSSA